MSGEFAPEHWPPMRVVVTGGRDFGDYEMVERVLDVVNNYRSVTELAHGGATGADALAGRWAEEHTVAVKVFPADWSQGRAAGPIRNHSMLTTFKPDLLVAFPGGAGTKNCKTQAARLGIPRLWARPHPTVRGAYRIEGAMP